MDEEEQIQNTLPEQDKQTLKDEGIEIVGKENPTESFGTATSAQKEVTETKQQTGAEILKKFQASIQNIRPENTDASKEADEIKALRTYKSDIADAVEHDHISAVKMATAESERRSNTLIEREEPKRRGMLFAAIGIIVLAIIIGISGYIFFKKNSAPPSTIQTTPATLVDVSSAQTVPVASGENVAQDFTTKIQGLKIQVGSLAQIIPVATNNLPIATSSNFFAALNITVPEQVLQSLDGTFTFGAYSSTENHPFLILGIKSFDDAFPGMLSWEQTIPDDLGFLIEIDHPRVVSSGTGPVFSDKIILNKDIRELDEASGTPEILYSFTDTKTLVITTDEATMSQIITRLNAGEVVR